MSSDKTKRIKKHQETIANPDDGFEMGADSDKSKVECICPKCDKKHLLNFVWIGRGTPRKYCLNCRDNL